jgi:hypothetical protein
MKKGEQATATENHGGENKSDSHTRAVFPTDILIGIFWTK